MKKNVVIAILLLALAGMGYLYFTESARFRVARERYEAQLRDRDAQFLAAQGRIEGLSQEIRARSEANAILQASVAAKDAKITLLSGQLANIVGQEPPTTPEVESLPIVINLRAQVAKLSEMFALSEAASKEKDDIIYNWEVKFNSQVKITLEWVRRYEQENALRLAAESMFKMSQRQSTKTKIICGAIAVAAVIYGATR